jgi:hypothetical protein
VNLYCKQGPTTPRRVTAIGNRKTLTLLAWKFTMADNKKQEKDFTKEVDALIPEVELIIKVWQSIHWISNAHRLPSLVNFKMV